MRIGIIGSGNIGATAARLAVDAMNYYPRRDGSFPELTGSLAEGGCRQQPGSRIYTTDLTAHEASEALGDLTLSP